MSHSYRTISDAKFEFGIFSTFGDMTHKLSLSKRGEQVIEFVYLPPGNGFKLLKNEVFVSRGVSFNLKLTLCQFQQFPSRRNFSIFKMFQTSQEKSSSSPLVGSILQQFSQIMS